MKATLGIVAAVMAAACLAPPSCGIARAAESESQRIAADLQARGVSGPTAGRIRAAFETGESESLPVESLRARLLEGLAKGAEPGALAAAIEARLTCLRSARDLIRTAGYTDPSEPAHGELLASTARAMESGLSAADLGAILARGEGRSGGRMQTVVESGESLTLAGVDAATVRSFMADCLDRNLRRMEMLRAARFSIQQHRGGMSGTEIRRALWGNDASQAQPLRGQGTGPGSGRGGPGGGPMGPPGGASAPHAASPSSAGAAGAGAAGPAGASAPGGTSPGPGAPGGYSPGPGGKGAGTR